MQSESACLVSTTHRVNMQPEPLMPAHRINTQSERNYPATYGDYKSGYVFLLSGSLASDAGKKHDAYLKTPF